MEFFINDVLMQSGSVEMMINKPGEMLNVSRVLYLLKMVICL